MHLPKKHLSQHTIVHNPKSSPLPDVGLALLDSSLKPVAFDYGAAAILNHPNPPAIPEEILRVIRGRKPAEFASIKAILRRGKSEYVCRAYLVEDAGSSSGLSFVALHFERDSSMSNAMYEAAIKYNLTEREQQALKGISMGLSNKQLSEQMNISPNTVRAFLRLIMVKMGVTSRSAIVAKILQDRGNLDRLVRLPSEQELAV